MCPKRTKKIAVIGIPGKWSTEVLADALEERTGFRHVLDAGAIRADLATRNLWVGETNLCDLDGIAVKKISQEYSPATLDRLELLRIAEARGVRVFSRAGTMLRMIDRLGCTATLRAGNIPMPETTVTENPREALAAVKSYGAAVFKPLYSTKARGMTIIEADRPDTLIQEQIDTFKAENPMMYIQRKVDLPGRDFGMVFVGGAYHGSYARVAQTDSWNTTIHAGGAYARHDPPQSTIDLARKAERLFEMDFTTVDVADTPDGPIVFEVSAFGGFKGAKEGLGLDAAGLYADHILKELAT